MAQIESKVLNLQIIMVAMQKGICESHNIATNIDAHRGGGRGGAPHVPRIKILKNFHIKMQ